MIIDRPVPAIMHDWATDSIQWAVLDASDPSRALWNQMVHEHPIVAGYITRTPERLWDAIVADPLMHSILPPPIGTVFEPPLPIPAEQARRQLSQLKVRFVVVSETRTKIPTQMDLPERYRGDGLVIYEVPRDGR